MTLYSGTTNLERSQEISASAAPYGQTSSPQGLSIIILNLDKPELIVPLVERLTRERLTFEQYAVPCEILIGDTGSKHPDVLALFENLPEGFKVIRGMRYHFSKNNNALAREQSAYATLLFLNNDIIFPDAASPVWEMYMTLATKPEVGLVGPYLWFDNGTLQHGGIQFLTVPEKRGMPYHIGARDKLPAAFRKKSQRVPALTGACLMLSKKLFEACDRFDEGYAAECQYVALCLSAHRLGAPCELLDLGQIVHLENATRPKGDVNFHDRARFLRRWLSYIEGGLL